MNFPIGDSQSVDPSTICKECGEVVIEGHICESMTMIPNSETIPEKKRKYSKRFISFGDTVKIVKGDNIGFIGVYVADLKHKIVIRHKQIEITAKRASCVRF